MSKQFSVTLLTKQNVFTRWVSLWKCIDMICKHFSYSFWFKLKWHFCYLQMFTNLSIRLWFTTLLLNWEKSRVSLCWYDAYLRKIPHALKAETKSMKFARGVGTKEGAEGVHVPPFFGRSVTLNQPGEQIVPPRLLLTPLDSQTFLHLYLLSLGYRS